MDFIFRLKEKILTKLRGNKALTYLYISSVVTILFSVVTNFAWGHWVPGEEFNFIQLIMRYTALGIFLAMPGMNDVAGIAAGKNDLRTGAVGLFYRIVSYYLLLIVIWGIFRWTGRSFIPGIESNEFYYFIIFLPVLIIPPYVTAVSLALNRYKWTAITRIGTAAVPAFILIAVFLVDPWESYRNAYLYFVPILTLIFLIPFFFVKGEKRESADRELLKYGVQSSVTRWPEFLFGFETVIVAAVLSPIHLTIYFLADRLSQHYKAFLMNHFSEAFSRYARIKDVDEIMTASKNEFWRSLKNIHVYFLSVALLIPIGLVVWRQEYWSAILICVLLCLIVVMGTPATFVRQGLIVAKDKKFISLYSTVVVLLQMGSMVILVPMWDLWGIVAAKFIGMVVGTFLIVRFGWKPVKT